MACYQISCGVPPGSVWGTTRLSAGATRFCMGRHQVHCAVAPCSVPVPPGSVWDATMSRVWCHQVQCVVSPGSVWSATRSNVGCHQDQCGVPSSSTVDLWLLCSVWPGPDKGMSFRGYSPAAIFKCGERSLEKTFDKPLMPSLILLVISQQWRAGTCGCPRTTHIATAPHNCHFFCTPLSHSTVLAKVPQRL